MSWKVGSHHKKKIILFFTRVAQQTYLIHWIPWGRERLSPFRVSTFIHMDTSGRSSSTLRRVTSFKTEFSFNKRSKKSVVQSYGGGHDSLWLQIRWWYDRASRDETMVCCWRGGQQIILLWRPRGCRAVESTRRSQRGSTCTFSSSCVGVWRANGVNDFRRSSYCCDDNECRQRQRSRPREHPMTQRATYERNVWRIGSWWCLREASSQRWRIERAHQ